jgi:hypothetical protein
LAAPGGAFDMIAGPQPVPAQVGTGHRDVIAAAPISGRANEGLACAGIEDSRYRDLRFADVGGWARQGWLPAGECRHGESFCRSGLSELDIGPQRVGRGARR